MSSQMFETFVGTLDRSEHALLLPQNNSHRFFPLDILVKLKETRTNLPFTPSLCYFTLPWW